MPDNWSSMFLINPSILTCDIWISHFWSHSCFSLIFKFENSMFLNKCESVGSPSSIAVMYTPFLPTSSKDFLNFSIIPIHMEWAECLWAHVIGSVHNNVFSARKRDMSCDGLWSCLNCLHLCESGIVRHLHLLNYKFPSLRIFWMPEC